MTRKKLKIKKPHSKTPQGVKWKAARREQAESGE